MEKQWMAGCDRGAERGEDDVRNKPLAAGT